MTTQTKNIKTMAQWHDSPHSTFSDFAEPNDEIDEEIYYYFLEVLPPIYHKHGIFQVSEAYNHNKEGKPRYSTFQKVNTIKNKKPVTKYFYLGIMTGDEVKEYSKIGF